MMKLGKIWALAIAVVTLAGVATPASAQILIIDEQRVEREAAAHKDFNLQTAELRKNFSALQQFVANGGIAEKQLAELDQRKAVIGPEAFETERRKLQEQYAVAMQQLNQLQVIFDRVREEASGQIERARQPVLRALLAERKAQVIMYKRLVLTHAAGLDVTTQFIERLDAALPAVTLSNLPTFNAPAASPAPEGNK